jgi:hypothetical protein
MRVDIYRYPLSYLRHHSCPPVHRGGAEYTWAEKKFELVKMASKYVKKHRQKGIFYAEKEGIQDKMKLKSETRRLLNNNERN